MRKKNGRYDGIALKYVPCTISNTKRVLSQQRQLQYFDQVPESNTRIEKQSIDVINSGFAEDLHSSRPPRTPRIQPLETSARTVNKKNKVHVSFFDHSLNEREIAKSMSVFGQVKHCYLARVNRTIKKAKGFRFGFVEFLDRLAMEDALVAVQIQASNGSSIQIKDASKKTKKRADISNFVPVSQPLELYNYQDARYCPNTSSQTFVDESVLMSIENSSRQIDNIRFNRVPSNNPCFTHDYLV